MIHILIILSIMALVAIIVRFIRPELIYGVHVAVTTVRMNKAFLDYEAGRITRPDVFPNLLIRDFRYEAYDSDEESVFRRVKKIRDAYRILARRPPVPGLATEASPEICIVELASLIGSISKHPVPNAGLTYPTIDAYGLLHFISNELRAREDLPPLNNEKEVGAWLTAHPVSIEQTIEMLVAVVFGIAYRHRTHPPLLLRDAPTEAEATSATAIRIAAEGEDGGWRPNKEASEQDKQKSVETDVAIANGGMDSIVSPTGLPACATAAGSKDGEDLPNHTFAGTQFVIRIFISYSHQDRKYLKKDSLLGFLSGLEEDGVEFWYDEDITAGGKWDAEIKANISESQIALILVSQAYLDSGYCRNVEIKRFLADARVRGMIMVPIMLSRCEWRRHEWLRNRRIMPKDDETIEDNYTRPGKRKKLFHEIRAHLRDHIDNIRSGLRHPQ